MTRLAALAVLALAAACSGSSGPKAHDAGVPSAGDLAAKFCSGWEQEAAADRELFTADEGTCTLDGQNVTVSTFTTRAARDQWLNVARKFGGRFVVLDRAVIKPDEPTQADAIKAKVGGTIST